MKYLTIALLISALALVIGVAGCKNQQAQTPPQGETTSATAEHDMAGMDHTAAMNAKTVKIGADEAACPVLGTVMKKSMMIPVEHEGTTYYMCCQDCVPKFKADPEKYLGHPAAATHEMKHGD